VVRPWARGDPPPHGSLSRRFLAIAIDLEGGRRTSAESPRKGIIDTYLTRIVIISNNIMNLALCLVQQISPLKL